MNKQVTNEELIALFNEIETEKIKAKSDIQRETTRLQGYVSEENIHKTYPNINKQIIEWIFEKREFSQISPQFQNQALIFLYSSKFVSYVNDKDQVIYTFLKATEDPKLIEVANKMQIFNDDLSISTKKKLNTAQIILLQGNSKEAIDKNGSFYYNGKQYTVKKELKQIKQKFKKASKKEAQNIKHFKNIYKIDRYNLYNKILEFLRNHGTRPYGLSTGDEINEYLQRNIETIVYENQYEATKMLYEQESLQFIKGQKQGKIR